MPLRPYAHPIPDDSFSAHEDRALAQLLSFRQVRDLALERGSIEIVGAFAPLAMSMAQVAWARGLPAEAVAARLADAVCIAAVAAEQGYIFPDPYDYWLLCCAAVALDHPRAEDLLALPSEQWSRTPLSEVVGLLPPLVAALALLAAGDQAKGPLVALRRQHEQALKAEGEGTDEARQEAVRFAPTVGAMVAISQGHAGIWAASCKARLDGWRKEAWLHPMATMFLLDLEWLAMMRMARQESLDLPADDVYRPHGLLELPPDPGTLGDRLGPST